MSSQNPARRHHYIPVFYLKRWIDRSGRLVEFSKPYGDKVKPRRVAPAGTGFVDRLYELRGLDSERAAYLEEKYFSPIDSRAADVLTNMETKAWTFSEKERAAWTQFLLSVVTRHPIYIEAMKAYYKSYSNDVTPEFRSKWSRLRKGHEPVTFEEVLESPGIAEYVERQSLQSMARFSQSEKLGTHIMNMIWGMRIMPFDVPALLTSDRPLQWYGALIDPNCHLVIPIGPKRIFWACNTERMVRQIAHTPAPALAAFINNTVVRRALRHVYALGDSPLAFVQERMGTNPEPQPPDRFTEDLK